MSKKKKKDKGKDKGTVDFVKIEMEFYPSEVAAMQTLAEQLIGQKNVFNHITIPLVEKLAGAFEDAARKLKK